MRILLAAALVLLFADGDAFRSTGQVGTIYFNDPGIRGVTPLKGHDDHLHVQLNQ